MYAKTPVYVYMNKKKRKKEEKERSKEREEIHKYYIYYKKKRKRKEKQRKIYAPFSRIYKKKTGFLGKNEGFDRFKRAKARKNPKSGFKSIEKSKNQYRILTLM